ncbi:hypothetical protein ACHAWF_006251 [Thalassiosira exigua]
MSSSRRAKVLIVGPVAGRLRLLSDKLSALQRSRAGPFDVCLCAGPFFAAEQAPSKSDEEGGEEGEEEVRRDGRDLADGTLTFALPVLFADPGGGPPDGVGPIHPPPPRDEDEIDLDDEEEEGGRDDGAGTNGEGKEGAGKDDPDVAACPPGLLRVAPNLYRLVGDAGAVSGGRGADVVSVPLPLGDAAAVRREHPTALTVGFALPNVRIPCPSYDRKVRHPSFLGCDVLLTGEWGQGMDAASCGALTADDRAAAAAAAGGTGSGGLGSYDVAELVATGRPRYHVAPGPLVPVPGGGGGGDDDKGEVVSELRRKFVASRPYRYPPSPAASASLGGGGGHAGRFLAVGSVLPPAEAKALGKAFKYVHAVGVVPLARMDVADREAAREADVAAECPYTDASYGTDPASAAAAAGGTRGAGGSAIAGGAAGGVGGGLSEARARRLAQEDAAAAMGAGGGGGGADGGAFRWQQRHRKRPRGDGAGGGSADDEEEAKRQAIEASNPENRSLFLHGLHRDPVGALDVQALTDAFRPYGCEGVRFPKPRPPPPHLQRRHHAGQIQKPSYAFLDFADHEGASRCLADLKGEAVVRNVLLTLKWSSGPARRLDADGGAIPPPPPRRRTRLTEAEAADSSTLFLRLPPAVEPAAYPDETEALRLLAQGTMEEELNGPGSSLDAPDRISAADEPALRVSARRPEGDVSYGFLEFASHAAALTTLVALTGRDDGGEVDAEKLRVSCLLGPDMERKDLSRLAGVALHWAKGGASKPTNGDGDGIGPKLGRKHFPADSRTDCWFCLASPTCEKHLIVSVRDEVYVTMPKGAADPRHALIVPVEHGGSGAMVDSRLAPELIRVRDELRAHARTKLGKDLFVFERCFETRGGYHSHVNLVPVDAASGPSIRSKMMEMATRCGFALKEITSDLGLSALGDDWSGGYFYAEVPLPGGGGDFRRFVYRAGDGDEGGANGEGGGGAGRRVPLQFGREVLAEVMGNPNIAQWKACVVSKEKEDELAEEFRQSLSET